MISTWTGAVSDDWTDAQNWSPSGVPGPGDTILIPASPSGGRSPEILDGSMVNVYGDITNDDVITLDSTGGDTDFVVNGAVTLSGAGALILSDSATNRIYSNTGGSTLVNQETIEGAGQIFSNGNLTLVNDAAGVVDATGDNALNIGNITVKNLGLLESTTGTGGLALSQTTIDNTDGGAVDSGRIAAEGGNVLIQSGVDVIGGTLSSAAGSEIEVVSTGSVLDGSQSAAIDIAAGAAIAVDNGANLTLKGVIQNDGQIQLDDATGNDTDLIANGAVTLAGSGAVVMADDGTQNANRIYSDVGGSVLDNKQTIEGAGEIFSNGNLSLLNDTSGLVDATGAHALAIHNIDVTNDGTLESTSGAGGLSIYSATITNTGASDAGQIVADGADTHVDFNGATVVGGALVSKNGGLINVVAGGAATLDGTNAGAPIGLAGGSVLQVQNGAKLTVSGVIANDGQIRLDDTTVDNTDLIANGSVTLEGSGVVVMADDGTINASRIYSDVGDSVLDNKETIRGAGEIFNNGNLTLINDATGVIDATGSHALDIHNIVVENLNLLKSAGAGGLEIAQATIDNTDGGTTDSGRIVANGGDVLLSSGDHIIGGTLTSAPDDEIEIVSTGGLLDGAQSAPIKIVQGSVVTVENGENITLNGVIENDGQIRLADTTVDDTDLIVNGPVTLEGSGVVTMADDGTIHASRIYSNVGGSVLDNKQTIEGAGEIFSNGNLTFDNDTIGVVDATGVNALAVHDIQFNNANLLESTAGAGGLSIYNATINNLADDDAGQIVADGAGVHVDINNSDIVGGRLISENAGVINVTAGSSDTFDGTQSGAPIDITSGSVVAMANGAKLNTTGAIENDGELQLNATAAADTDLIVNGPVTLEGGGAVVLSDSGTVGYNRIYSNVGGSVLDNQQTIEGAGEIFSNGNLTFDNDTTGVVDATGANALAVHDILFNNANLLESTGTGGLSIYNATISNLADDDAGQIVADGAGAHVDINNSDIVGGRLVSENGGVINATAGSSDTFDGTQSGAPIDITGSTVVSVVDSAKLIISGAIENDGQLQLNAASADDTDLIVNGAATLEGGGAVVLSDNGTAGYNRIYSDTGGSVLDNQETIEGAGEIFSNGNLSLLNDTSGGVIDANGVNALDIHDMSFTNDGVARAENGGTLQIVNALTNLSADPNHAGGAVLTGGVYDLIDQITGGAGPGVASTIAISSAGVGEITTLAATVDLAGQPSQLTSNGVSLANSLVEIGAGGALDLFYGFNSESAPDFSDPNAVTIDDGGEVVLSGAAFSTSGLAIAAGGVLQASGEFNAVTAAPAEVGGAIVNGGEIIVDGSQPASNSADDRFFWRDQWYGRDFSQSGRARGIRWCRRRPDDHVRRQSDAERHGRRRRRDGRDRSDNDCRERRGFRQFRRGHRRV